MSPEEAAAARLRQLGADYVLVVFGGVVGYSNDDLNKLPWLLRIAKQANPALEARRLERSSAPHDGTAAR